jgi:hypothetical protein
MGIQDRASAFAPAASVFAFDYLDVEYGGSLPGRRRRSGHRNQAGFPGDIVI